MDIIVIGGGCYGTFQTRRLLKAIDAGRIGADARIVIIDRNGSPPAKAEFSGDSRVVFAKSDWSSFLTSYFLEYAGNGDQLIPAHIAPHLLFDLTEFIRKNRLMCNIHGAMDHGLDVNSCHICDD